MTREAPRAITGGFTIIELMMVAIILSLLALLVVPMAQGSHRDAVLKDSARAMAEAARLASSLAVTRGEPHRLVIDPARGRYRIEARGAGGGGPEVVAVPGAVGSIDPRIAILVAEEGEGTPENGGASHGGAGGGGDGLRSIEFLPDGTAEPRDIHLRDREGFGLAIRIDGATARARPMRLEREEGR